MSFRGDDGDDALEELASPRPLRRDDSGGDAQTSRLLEALEALSSETGGAMPPSLRSLLGQLQGDENAMAGLFPFMQLLDSHGSHPRFQRMLQSIDADAPAHVQLSGLSELCESLSMSSEESLVVSGFSVDKFLPPVTQLVRAPSTMEVLLLAARALSSMFELFPTVAVPKAMAAGPALVDSICAKLLEIEYMDVAELAFQILERIVFSPQSETLSAEYRRTVIAANGFVALLQFVDFFPIEIQRTAARVVAGLCTNIGTDSTGELQLALPLIAGLLRSSDVEIIQHGCKSFQAMVTSPAFVVHEDFAQLVANEDTCSSLAQILESFAKRVDGEEQSANSQVPVRACASLLQFMSAVLSSPHDAMNGQVKKRRFIRLPPTVATLLGMQTIVDDVLLLRETLKLVGAILPTQGTDQQDHLEGYQNTMRPFVRAILPSVIQVYEVSGRKDVRHDCLAVILRVCLMQQKVEQADRDSTELIHLSSFLARVLRPESVGERSEKAESRISCVALQIVQACLQSDSSIAMDAKCLFERYGVNAAIRRFSTTEESTEAGGVGALTKLLVDEYIGEQDESTEPSMELLRKTVRDLEASLAGTNEDLANRSDTIFTILRELLKICRDRQESAQPGAGWLTAHEIASSGLSKALTRLLQDGGGRRAFAEIFLGQSDESAASVFIKGLVSSIQDAISAEKDAFRVDGALSESSMRLSTGSVTSDMDQLTQHIKVKVKIEDNETASSNQDVKRNKRGVHDTVVLVEPLARIDTIEEFIADKLFGSRSPFGAIESEEDELLGPRHRRRARSQESDVEEKSDHDEDDAIEDHDEEDPEDDHEDENDDLRSDRPQKQKRLQVLYGGVVMREESSVLEAILKQPPVEGKEGSSGDLAKVWTGAPHEFVFRVLSEEGRKDSKESDALTPDESTSTESAQEDSKSPSKWWDDVWDLLEILQHLHQLIDDSKRVEFVNGYITLQVHRALSQPVRVMTNSLPSWSYRIVEQYPFVLNYDTRFDFMYATTSGAPRAISYLCRTLWKKAAFAEEPAATPPSGRENSRSSRRLARDRNGASSRNATAALANLSRMAKLPRLKVRVARSRLLQSAMKLFTMYGGKKAIIEIEFLGEVGTGLGPTTEFYTLVCHEIQASHLKLWRNDKDVPTDDGDSDENTGSDLSAKKKNLETDKSKKPGLPVRGYHRVAVFHCPSCKHLEIPRCSIHDMLLTHEKSGPDDNDQPSSESIPQCAKCLDSRDWRSSYTSCKSCDGSKANEDAASGALAAAAASSDDSVQGGDAKPLEKKKRCALRWWILSEEEVLYLHKVYPREVETIKHPVLQCTHCDTVNFPGTDAGIVILDHTGERMVSRAGRRMYERDYRAVTKHVSPLCEGTPLKQIGVVLTRDAVETLVDCAKKSPELLDSEVESLSYMSEVAQQGEVEVVDAPHGLFPKPYKQTKATEKDKLLLPDTLTWFNFMGRFVAQAILDERLLNLPFSRAFLRALRGETLVGADVDIAQSIEFVREVDPAIAQSLSYLLTVANEAAAETDAGELESKANLVESMGLAFTLVGDGSIELREGGKAESVFLENLHDYVRLNMSFLLHETIHRQVGAFYEGFETISGCADTRQFLRSFALPELEFLFADKGLAGDSMWSRDGKELREHMVCDHGYSPLSRAIHDLVAILCELSLEEQRLFVKFVTGANRLPLGGLAKLEPKLTVVRKLASGEDGEATDAVLPSASTCTNYLKLPEYSTREAMRSRLLYCIHEGQGSFHLS